MKKYDLNVKDENQFGKNLYNLRKAYGEKLEDIGEILGVGPNTVSQYTSGTRKPSLTSIKILAEHFGTTVDELLNDDFSFKRKLNINLAGRQRIRNMVTQWVETVFPLISSEEAMKNESFRFAYIKCAALIENPLECIALSEPDYRHYLDLYKRAGEEDVFYEAAADSVWLIFYEWASLCCFTKAEIMRIFCPGEGRRLSAIRAIRDLSIKAMEASADRKQEFIRTEGEYALHCIQILKSKSEWADLGDYYLALKYLFGLQRGNTKALMNGRFGLSLLRDQMKMGNQYAIRFFQLMGTITGKPEKSHNLHKT